MATGQEGGTGGKDNLKGGEDYCSTRIGISHGKREDKKTSLTWGGTEKMVVAGEGEA